MLVQNYKYIYTWVFYNQEYKFSNFLLCIWSLRHQNVSQLHLSCLHLTLFCSQSLGLGLGRQGRVLEKYFQVSLGTHSYLLERGLATGVFTFPRPGCICPRDFG